MMDKWKVLVVDDESEQLEQVKDRFSLSLPDCKPICERVFTQAEQRLKDNEVDLVVLDIREGSQKDQVDKAQEAGIQAFRMLKSYEFVPVIFRSNVANQAPAERRPWLSVISKDAGPDELVETIRAVIDSGLPSLLRTYREHVRSVARETLWSWADAIPATKAPDPTDGTEVAYFLMRRLGRSLEREELGALIERLGGHYNSEGAHPSEYYLWPPVGEHSMAGDVYTHCDYGSMKYLILVTPTCDLVHTKGDALTFIECVEVSKHPLIPAIVQGAESKNKLGDILGNRVGRYHFLPAARVVPALFADLQRVRHVPRSEVEDTEHGWDRVATLDHPFAEALVSRFASYFGRIGTPDLPVKEIRDRIIDEASTPTEAEA